MRHRTPKDIKDVVWALCSDLEIRRSDPNWGIIEAAMTREYETAYQEGYDTGEDDGWRDATYNINQAFMNAVPYLTHKSDCSQTLVSDTTTYCSCGYIKVKTEISEYTGI